MKPLTIEDMVSALEDDHKDLRQRCIYTAALPHHTELSEKHLSRLAKYIVEGAMPAFKCTAIFTLERQNKLEQKYMSVIKNAQTDENNMVRDTANAAIVRLTGEKNGQF